MPRSQGVQPYTLAALDRIAAKSREEGDCWVFRGTIGNHGYGVMNFGTRSGGNLRQHLTHRHAYQILVVELPPELKIDHLCRNRPCWRPDHLEPVTDRVNIHRGESGSAKNARKTHCSKNHPLSGENLYQRPGHPEERRCRICMAAWNAGRAERAAARSTAALARMAAA